jgi:cytochrome c-type biogenesis protein CcmH/NrfG
MIWMPLWYWWLIVSLLVLALLMCVVVLVASWRHHRRNSALGFYQYVQRQEAAALAKDHIDRLYQAARDMIRHGPS